MSIKVIETKKLLNELLKRYDLNKVVLSFSGGKDSTILLHLIEQLGFKNKIRVVFSNTGFEYDATLNFIEQKKKEGWNIETIEPVKCAPIVYKEYGIPLDNKYNSEMIYRLQQKNIDFKELYNSNFETMYKKYNKSKCPLMWYYKKTKMLNISNKLKEYLNTINYKVSSKCCYYLKKLPFKKFNKENNIQLSIIGIRKNEGGIRNTIKNCFKDNNKVNDIYYPLLHWTNEDVEQYIKDNNIKLSYCYIKYGLDRTGCVGCPYSKYREKELQILEKYEPKKFRAVQNLFKNNDYKK